MPQTDDENKSVQFSLLMCKLNSTGPIRKPASICKYSTLTQKIIINIKQKQN
jgi:hypothetical protein